jgi:hypothetical protein
MAASFDFAGALASGATPQAITQYLGSQGMGNLASTYFNQQPAQPDSFESAINSLKSFAANVVSPITTAAVTAGRTIEATPKVASAVADAIAGKGEQANQNIASGNQILAEPALGQNTVEGNTPEQNLGQALKAGSLALPGIGEEASGVLGTANEGLDIGMAQGAGQAMTQNANTQDVAKGAIEGAVMGAGAGVALPVAIGAAGKLGDAISDTGSAIQDSFSKAPETPPADQILKSRIADATPDYSKKMVGQVVTNPDGETVPRVNEGEGLTGDRTVNTSKAEAVAGKELANIKDYPDNGTALQKSQAVYKEISSEAQGMRSGLVAEDKATPLDAAAEKTKVASSVLNNMPEDVQQTIADGKSLPKTAAGKYYQTVLEATDKYDGSRVGKLDLRQSLDSAYETARGKLAWGSDTQNALDETHTEIRDSLNKDLSETTKNTDTQASLDKQSKLYRAKDVLDQKAAAEATSKTGRFMQNHPQARFLGRFAERRGLSTALQATGAAAAITAAVRSAKK